MIKFYSINREDWELGHDYATCQSCGAHIRHVVEIEGTAFGRSCAATQLGWKKKSAQAIGRKVGRIVHMLEGLANVIERQKEEYGPDWFDWDESLERWAENEAFLIIQDLEIEDPYNGRPGDDYCAGWKYAEWVHNTVGTGPSGHGPAPGQ